MRYLITIRFADGSVAQVPSADAATDGYESLGGVRSVLVTELGNGSMLVDSWYADRDAELLIDQ